MRSLVILRNEAQLFESIFIHAHRFQFVVILFFSSGLVGHAVLNAR